jgi:hypothetical protein
MHYGEWETKFERIKGSMGLRARLKTGGQKFHDTVRLREI